MKLNQLKTIVKEAVREAIQEEMKDILLEAVRSPKQTVYESGTNIPSTVTSTPSPTNPVMQSPLPAEERMKLKENMMNVLGGMMPGKDGTLKATTQTTPLQMSGNMDTTSPNGQLPQGDVSMDMIMGLMNK
jgi:hypothetical protein